VTVDNLVPTARNLTNRTTGYQLNLTVKEDLVTRFDGGNSTDLLLGVWKGEIAEWNWDFDSDGTADRTGRLVTFNYSTPGTFTANLTVIDRVGHKSANQTLAVTVEDTTPPVPNVVIVDENNSWREVTQLTENKGYWFNVSRTTDNSLNSTADNVNLTYTFNWGDVGPSNKTGPFLPSATGLLYINVTKTYATHGEFKLSINVTDRAGNVGWLNRTLVVQANTTAHPDLSILAGSLSITPASPEENQLATFTFKVANGADRATATSLRFQLILLVGGRDTNVTVTELRWLNADGTPATEIAAGKNVTVEFKWSYGNLGNHTIRIEVWDDDEPKNAITNANKLTTNLLIREAGWKPWAWVGAFLFIIIGLPAIWYLIRKFRAGELHLPRRRREEGEEEEEEEAEEDEDEEEEGGKKRL
jgi:PKD repeat protein